MANKVQWLVGLSAGSVALFLGGVSFAQESGFYLNADIGPAWREQVTVKRFLDIPNAGKFKFDTGVRFDFAVGYQFLPWLSGEFETGVIANGIQDQGDSSLDSVPLMFNLVAKTQIWDRVTPFAGVGIGGVLNTLWADDIVGFGRIVHGDDTDCVFGWQGFVGAKYNISDRWDVSLAYRYLWADDSSWDVQSGTPFGFPVTERIAIGSTDTHAVVLGATFRF